ncbi:DNA translocase FtsK [Candidatus Enterovibrio escicola]|uniref:DNA translocase FtsK n=1 Tax=Candidatus Enterovibrio escicola TaxID=1927127 RepID=UPI001237ABF8|nr:DNA translocase FtsK 4TM domain-containing protein [Candidatus Enterovibrio escacola]
MRQEHKQTDTTRRLSGRQRLKETVLILALLSAVFILVALLSYDYTDPSWSQTAWDGVVQNAAGTFGAWVADTLFFMLGTLAYPFPLFLVLGGWVFFYRRGDSEAPNFTITATRLLGVVLLLLTSCGLADLNFDDFWYFSSGGVIGNVLNSITLPLFNLLGSTLVFLFLWATGFMLFTGISWLTIVETLGEKTLLSVTLVVDRLRGDKPWTRGIMVNTSKSVDATDVDKNDPLFTKCLGNDAREVTDQKEFNKIKHINQFGNKSDIPSIHTPSSVPTELKRKETIITSVVISEETKSDEINGCIEDAWSLSDRATTDCPNDTVIKSNDEDVQTQGIIHTLSGLSPEAPMVNEFLNDGMFIKEKYVDASFSDESNSKIKINNTDDLSGSDSEQIRPMILDEYNPFFGIPREDENNFAGTLHPFLVKDEPNLLKPKESLPTIDLLDPPRNIMTRASDEELQYLAKLIESRLEDYKIKVTVKGIFPGPVITRFELDPAPGVKGSRIVGLAKDIARSLSTKVVRVVDVIPGKPYIGLELPNTNRETVYMSDVIASERFQSSKSPLTVVLGKDIAGDVMVTDLSKAPHMLVAGTTGSGKSVGVNVMIISMLYKASPEDVRFIMIDPKMLELSVYEGIPHLLTEVVTDMKDAGNALRWCVAEMERRYQLMSALGVRNIGGFNDKVKKANEVNHPIPDPLWKLGDRMDETVPVLVKLPYIVVIVDEFADLMMVVGKKVEELIARLAQKARAAGIHLVLATQRPSVDVITGLIKANIPTRLAFTVSTKIDSRTILDQGGAESLLGMGDMLFMPNGSNHPARIHGAFVNDDEVHRVVSNWKARGKPQYFTDITNGDQGSEGLLPSEVAESTDDENLDQLFDQVVIFITESRRASVSSVQRRFKIGYNRAARIVEQLEAQGIVSPPGHNSNREVLVQSPPLKN